jgi:hypothetical protein
MDHKTYQQIYRALNSKKDIHRISIEFSQNTCTISNILHQKTVRNVKKCQRQMIKKAPAMVRLWQKGDTILEIARNNNYPPVLMASILLKEMGIKSKSVIKNPQILQDDRLRHELIQAIDTDVHFSSKAHELQTFQGKIGEELIHTWLSENNLDFMTESDLNKTPNTKTPDFLLYEPMDINSSKVMWIESKAVFADEIEHNRYQKKQFQFYEELYGPGMVVYWYGFVDSIVPNNCIIKDYAFFEELEYDLDRLLDYEIM